MYDLLVERFMRYVQYDTTSAHDATCYPSTAKQLDFAKVLADECTAIGLSGVTVDEFGTVYAYLPANVDKDVPAIGFLAHMDTSPDYSGTNVKPILHKNYDGSDIVLNGLTISANEFPAMKKLVGCDLITADGTTLLGADDKAGIAEIITAVDYLIKHPEIPHGKVCVAFTPDEEVGAGVEHFDVKLFGADFGYTLDGGHLGGIEYESFNAATAKIFVHGKSVHPGTAKGVMKNAGRILAEIAMKLPQNEIPERTAGYEGFIHMTSINGGIPEAEAVFIIRDHDRDKFNAKKDLMIALVDAANAEYGEGTVNIHIIDSYFNMKEKVHEIPAVFNLLESALKDLGITQITEPIRGGTDGARLSFMGLPCPNMFAGGGNAHGPYEYACVQTMEKAVDVVLKILELAVK